MNYLELQQQIAGYMHRTDLSADIPGFIEKARTRINRDLRASAMLVQVDVVPIANPFEVAADFLEMRDLYHSQGSFRVSLQLVGRKQLDAFANTQGSQSPSFYSVDGTQIETAPGGVGTEFTAIYYQSEPALVADSDESITMELYPSIWLYGSMVEANSFVQDLDLMKVSTDMYVSEIQRANESSNNDESGASLQIAGASNWI